MFFPEDASFWKTLSQEEKIHVLLLQEACIQEDNPTFVNRLHELKEINRIVNNKLGTYREVGECTKSEIFEDAIEIEAAIAKVHLDIAKAKKIGKKGLQAFLFLNRRDRDNLSRIKKYAYNCQVAVK